jgi:hypothetical protein
VVVVVEQINNTVELAVLVVLAVVVLVAHLAEQERLVQ